MSKPDFSKLASDATAEHNGVWRTWTNGRADIEFLLARAGGSNDEFRIMSEKETRVFRKAGIDMAALPPSKQDEVTRKIYAHTIVKNWRGSGVDGIPFSPENCIALFEQVHTAFAFCINEATNAQNFESAVLEAEAGN
jgi:hypothetical protein